MTRLFVYLFRSKGFLVFLVLLIVFIIWSLCSDEDRDDLRRLDGGQTEEDIDESRLFGLNSFKYHLEPKSCPKAPLLGVILVTSYVGHDDVRAAHRQGISQNELHQMGLHRIFLISEIPPSERFITQPSVLSENRRFGDLLQGSFVENYRNLTYKHVMGLKWAAKRCSHAKFIIKIDDDSVYDIYRVHAYLQKRESDSRVPFLGGYIFPHQKPIRLEADKHFVTPEEFPDEEFPPYLSGWLYLTNAHAVRMLLKEAERKKFFWIDDTFVTGILAEGLSIPFTDLTEWFSANPDFLDCCVRDMKRFNLECEFVIGPNGGDTKLLPLFQNEAKKCLKSKSCRLRHGAAENLRNTCVTEFKDVLRNNHGSAIVRPIKL